MVSFIILSKNANEGREYIIQQCNALHISPFDRILLSKETLEKSPAQSRSERDKSLGIAEIKTLQKKMYLKPMQGNDKAVIIQDAALLTNEAQNALLKVLEEPPNHTYIYILADSLRTFLPTTLSRCKIVQLHMKKERTEDTETNMTNFLSKLPSMTIGKKLRAAETQGKQKQTAVDWLENILMITRTLLLTSVRENRTEQIRFYMQFIQQTQTTLEEIQSTNVNVRLALEHLLLSF